MIAWTRTYIEDGDLLSFGLHDTGVVCIMDSFLISNDRAAHALLTHGEAQIIGNIFSGCYRTDLCRGNAGQATELLDQYITEHNLPYRYDWPEDLEEKLALYGWKKYLY